MLKKFILIFIGLAFLNAGKAQTYLTNGEVYDFEIGDTIQSAGYKPWNNYSISYITNVIINKTINSTSTTIVYTIQSSTLTPLSNRTTDTIVQIITNLSSPALQNNHSGVPLKDTLYSSYCGHTVWEQDPAYPCEGGPCTQEQTSVIKGLGGPYFLYNTSTIYPTTEQYFAYELVYYAKGSDRCGSLIITSVPDISKDPGLAVYPNPNNGQFSVTHKGSEKLSIQIIDLNGKLVLEQRIDNISSVDASHLHQGVYNLVIIGPGYSFNKKLVIVH